MSDATEHDLLMAWRGGDETAGTELVVRLFPAVYRFFASKLADGVEDLTQRTFLACVESRERLPDAVGLRAFVLGIARNVLLQHLRVRHRDAARFSSTDTSVEALGESPSEMVAAREEQRILLAALRRIPLDFQITIELTYWEDMSGAEVAFVLGIEESTVRSRLTRARQLLETKIRQAAAKPQQGESTIRDLAAWARSLRDALPRA